MPMEREAGFSLLEVLIATTITVTITAGVLVVIGPAQGIADSQPEFADVQQRLRVGVDMLHRDLLLAGAGSYAGAQSGSLVAFFAPVLPYSRGLSAEYDDGPGAFRTDAVTVVYVPSTASQTTLRVPMPDASRADVNADPGCPFGDASCGFGPGTTAVVYDGTGAFDVFSVTNAAPAGTLALERLLRTPLPAPYGAGSKIAEVVRRTYAFDAGAMRLLRYDGAASAAVVLDNVVGLEFEYYGDPEPPAFRRPGVDRSVTYGPAPPPLDVSQPSWPPGENCVWQAIGGRQIVRMASLATPGALVHLARSQLTDGPWCPSAVSDNRYDADLLRIRKIRVAIRLQTGNARLRAAPGSGGRSALFVNAGSATTASRMVPDQSIQFDVVPRNMNLSR